MNEEHHLRTWNTYQSAWGPVDASERRRLLGESVSDGIAYADPMSQAHGVEELIIRIGQSQEMFPGACFRNDSFLEHHGQGLFQWTMYDATGAVFVKGSSFAVFGEDGRLVQATGFFAAPASSD